MALYHNTVLYVCPANVPGAVREEGRAAEYCAVAIVRQCVV